MADALGGPAMVFNVGPDGTIVYVHRSLPTAAADDVCNTSIFDHTDPQQQEVVRAALARVFATGEAEEYECCGFPPFIEDAWYECRMAPNEFEDNVFSATIIMRDVSRWKRAEEQLRQERDQLKVQQDRDKQKLEQLSGNVARLTANRLERERERERAQIQKDRDRDQLEALSAEVTRLGAILDERDQELEMQRIQQVKDRLAVATTVGRHATKWKQAEAALQRERARQEEQVERLSDELAKQTYWLDRQDRERDRFRRVLDQAGEAILIIDPKTGRFVDANETACRWLGYSREKLVTLRTDDLDLEFPVDASDELPEHVVETRKKTRPQVLRNGVMRRRNGTTFAVEVAIAHARLGDRACTLVVARDTNARRRVEEALLEGEEQYRNLFNLSHDAIYLSARDGTVADVNAAAVELFGYTREEFLGLEAKKLYERTEEIRTFQRAVDDKGFVRDIAVQLRAKNGTPIRGLLTATLRHAGDGRVLGYQCIIRPLSSEGPQVAPVGSADFQPGRVSEAPI